MMTVYIFMMSAVVEINLILVRYTYIA